MMLALSDLRVFTGKILTTYPSMADSRPATASDIAEVLVGLGAERQYLCKNHSSLLTGDSGMCEAWEGHLEPWASEGPVNCVEVEVLVWRQETPK